MKILILGNGFDVANNLPTKYPQFLNMCKLAIACGRLNDISHIRLHGFTNEEEVLLTQFFNCTGKDIYNEFVELTRGNLFFNHFCETFKIKERSLTLIQKFLIAFRIIMN